MGLVGGISLWWIVGAPALAAVAVAALALARRAEAIAPYLTALATSAAGLTALANRPSRSAGVLASVRARWLTIGDGFHIEFGVHLDALTWIMVGVVCSVSLLVQIYSIGYMRGERGYARYFAYISLFTMSMLGLVVADNIFQLYVCWELVGICSYLLIGFWWARPSAASAAKKAFIVTRFGDVGFMLGLLMLAIAAGSFDYDRIAQAFQAIGAGRLQASSLVSNEVFLWLAPLLLFCGAVGKSAQFPLHVWLPDAMEGPTPVSALIHAATMVAAGVYMVARLGWLFAGSGVAGVSIPLEVVLLIGAVTALMAATIAMTQRDIKKVLAYSTVSQLGFMMMALGAGGSDGQTTGLFHLTTHAFFKALLFLAAGSVIHAMHHAHDPNDLGAMGGLGRRMPWTALTCGLGVLALAGLPPFSGFWSKDAIAGLLMERAGWLSHGVTLASEAGPRPWVAAIGASVALLVTVLTAFYSIRLWVLAFAGSSRSEAAAHAKESPAVMVLPLAILALPTVGLGWWLHHGGLLTGYLTGDPGDGSAHLAVMVTATLLALLGAAVAAGMYRNRTPDNDPVAALPAPIYRLWAQLWYVDAFWSRCAAPVLIGVGRTIAWFDRSVVDGAIRGTGPVVGRVAGELRRMTNGQAQLYAVVVLASTVALIMLLVLYEAAATGGPGAIVALGVGAGAGR